MTIEVVGLSLLVFLLLESVAYLIGYVHGAVDAKTRIGASKDD